MKLHLLSAFILLSLSAFSQQESDSVKTKSIIGFELDALPYVTGGYYGSVWLGRGHLRYRAIIAKVTTPEFFVEEGFTNNKIQAYAAIVDYFFKPEFEKWWVGAGLEYWNGSIQTDAKLSTANYDNTVFTIGTGYVWKFYKNFYLNPWAAIHMRIGGDKSVTVDNQEFSPPAITPEVSIKIGWHF